MADSIAGGQGRLAKKALREAAEANSIHSMSNICFINTYIPISYILLSLFVVLSIDTCIELPITYIVL